MDDDYRRQSNTQNRRSNTQNRRSNSRLSNTQNRRINSMPDDYRRQSNTQNRHSNNRQSNTQNRRINSMPDKRSNMPDKRYNMRERRAYFPDESEQEIILLIASKVESIIRMMYGNEYPIDYIYENYTRVFFEKMRSRYSRYKDFLIGHLVDQTYYLLDLPDYPYNLVYMWTKYCNNLCTILRHWLDTSGPDAHRAPLLPQNPTLVENNDVYYAYYLWRGVPPEEINRMILAGIRHIPIQQMVREILSDIEAFQRVVNESPKPQNFCFNTSRGVCGREISEALTNIEVNEYYIEFTPLSTSIDVEVAHRFAVAGPPLCKILQYQIDNKTPTIFVDAVSAYPGEWEVTMPPFSIYKKIDDGVFEHAGSFEYVPINMAFGERGYDTLTIDDDTSSYPISTKFNTLTFEESSESIKFPQLANCVFRSNQEKERFERFLRDKNTLSVLNYEISRHGGEMLHSAIFFT
jgi:hypothetical protein